MNLKELDANKNYKGYYSGPKQNNHNIILEKTEKWIRVKSNDKIIVNSKNSYILLENGHLPIYYFSKTDINMKLLNKNEKSTTCPYKGTATYWDIIINQNLIENAAWSYESPIADQEQLKGLVAFYWKSMDHWYEEEEEIFSYPKDPYVRIDALRSSRNIKIYFDDHEIVNTNKSIVLYETHKKPAYYIPIEDIQTNLLFSSLIFRCPYKGMATYLSIEKENKIIQNICKQYTNPRPEVARIKNLICFNENDLIHINTE